MISGGIEVHQFASISLIIEAKFSEDPLVNFMGTKLQRCVTKLSGQKFCCESNSTFVNWNKLLLNDTLLAESSTVG